MKIASVFAGLLLAVAPNIVVRADDVATNPVPPEIQRPLDNTVSGPISGIDASTRILKLSGAFANKIFKVNREAKVVISTMPEAKLEDLKVGDQVEVSYQEKDGVFLVSHITKVEAIAPPATK